MPSRLQTTLPCPLDRIRRHRRRNIMDPRVQARTCIRTRDRLPCELPGQTWPSLKSFLTLYFSLSSLSLFCMFKPNLLLSTQDMVSSSSLPTSFSFPFPFPSSPKLNPHKPSSLEF